MTTLPSDIYDKGSHDPAPKTKCRACGRLIGNYFAGRVSHGRAEVRKGLAVEERGRDGFIAFRLRLPRP